jgi:hypothetical protein
LFGQAEDCAARKPSSIFKDGKKKREEAFLTTKNEYSKLIKTK